MNRIKKSKRIRRQKVLRLAALLFAVSLSVILIHPSAAKAEVATDYLSIRIGYASWDLDEYVETACYHFSELEAYAYDDYFSYFNGKERSLLEKDGGGTGYYEYDAVVDYAYGVDLRQLLEMSHVYFGDIWNILFWVEDHGTIWCAFDRDDLFSGRYYFPDISGNRTVYYDDGARPYAYTFNYVGNEYEVSPMMALEDAWISFSEGNDHSIIDEASAIWQRSPANRFRLLFGQKYLTEGDTQRSAKYVSTIYVTYWGAPTFGEMPELDGTLGAHQVDVQVETEADMRDALSELMRLSSTDENVLQITGMEVLPDEYFSNLSILRISYEIVGEGQAGIAVGVGRNGEVTQVTNTVNTADFTPAPSEEDGNGGEGKDPSETTEDPSGQPSDETSEDPSGEEGQNPGEESEGEGTPEPEKTEPTNETQEDVTTEPEQTSPSENPDDSLPPQNDTSSEPLNTTPAPVNETEQEVPAEQSVEEAPEPDVQEAPEPPEVKTEAVETETAMLEAESKNAVILMKKLSNSAASEFEEAKARQEAAQRSAEMAIYNLEKADQEIDQLQIEDNTEEKEAEKRRILIATAATCAGLMVLGAFSSGTCYRIRLRKARIIEPKHSFTKWLRGEEFITEGNT